MPDLPSTRCYFVVLDHIVSIMLLFPVANIKEMFSSPAPHPSGTKIQRNHRPKWNLGSMLTKLIFFFPLQKPAKTTQGKEKRRKQWGFQSVEGPTRGTDLGSWGIQQVRTGMFYKGEGARFRGIQGLTHYLEINKLSALHFFYIQRKTSFQSMHSFLHITSLNPQNNL